MLLIYTVPSSGQFSEHFDDGLGAWSGDVEHFAINDEHQLQLSAPAAGSSYIWTQLSYPEDVEFSMYIKMNFAPSDNNRTKIYLLSENSDPSIGYGYVFNLGENGSNDAIKILSTTGGEETLLASGTMGGIADEPVEISIQFSIIKDGMRQLKVDYNGGSFYVPELEFIDDMIDLTANGFLAIDCKYSSTRTDKFFFDDIVIKAYEEDISAPEVISALVLNENQIEIVFNELLDEIRAETPDNYLIKETGNKVSNILVNGNEVILTFENSFVSGPSFTLEISAIADLAGNISQTILIPDLFYAVPPQIGDLLINEILFDPFPGENDFLELYNPGDKIITLKGLEIHNTDRGDLEVIDQNIMLQPGAYVAISLSPDLVSTRYNPPTSADLVLNKLPAFNNDNGNVSLVSQGITIDAFDYDEEMHSPIIVDPEGVSLERISPDIPTDISSNWTSGQEINGFATPGYQNGALINASTSEDMLSLRETNFSPNGDGDKDFMVLDYNLDKPGYLATIKIFNDLGYQMVELANNLSLGSSGFIQWDGVTDEGKVGRIGVYIVMAELFHPDGDTIQKKCAVVLVKDL
jgi:hypothetical protein